jgi:hypothetical protein
VTRPTVTVDGLPRLVATMRAAARRAAALEPANRTVAAALVARARPPRRTGALAASLTAGSSPTEATMTSSLAYAGVIAHGWPRHGIEATNFDTAALSAVTPEALDTYNRHLADTVATIKGA